MAVGPRAKDARHRLARREHGREVGHGDTSPSGQGNQVERGFGHQTQGALGPHEQALQVRGAVSDDGLHPVAGAVLDHVRHPCGDQRALGLQSAQHVGEGAGSETVAGEQSGERRAICGQSLRPEERTVCEDGLHSQHVVLRTSVGHCARSGGVGAYHAAQAAVVLAGGVGSEEDPAGAQFPVQRPHHHARLHPHPGGVVGDLEDPVHVAGEVDLDAGPHRASRQSRSHPPRHEGQSARSGVFDQTHDILGVPGSDDSQRPDLVQTCVGSVQRSGDVVELHVAGKQTAQIGRDVLHGRVLLSYQLTMESRNI